LAAVKRVQRVARKLKSDKVLFVTTILLVGVSIVMVYSASAVMAMDRYRQPAFIWTALGLVSLGLIVVLFGTPVNGARRWLGVFGLGVQPSELAKLVAIFFIAALLERRMHRINDIRYALMPIGIVVLLLVALILPEP